MGSTPITSTTSPAQSPMWTQCHIGWATVIVGTDKSPFLPMTFNFANEEIQYLVNALLNQDATRPQYDPDICRLVANKILHAPINLESPDVRFLQTFLQEQSEIYGRMSSTANEKQPVTLASFSMQKQQGIIVSIAGKLGCNTKVISNNQPPSIPNSPRQEGSRHIMVDPTLNDKFPP